ncbi:UNVERIFIED_CONTAM: hypothetical protein Sangu_2984900 [Sesamum angustifolium]|uniref:Uncharacterized protein n=1 Tax=Sesamum angustifolium TaxID=2727405 RepID=A0AAW2IJ66_9LAMI
MNTLVKDLGLPIEKIDTCNNGCMLYWKDDVDLEYCKFCGDARYKPSRGQDPQQTKFLYVVLRYLPLTLFVEKNRVMFGWAFAQMVLRCTVSTVVLIHVDPLSLHRTIFSLYLINVYLEPLIEELLQLWHVGVRTYDHAMDNAFIMRAALIWTVNDLPAYGMASG